MNLKDLQLFTIASSGFFSLLSMHPSMECWFICMVLFSMRDMCSSLVYDSLTSIGEYKDTMVGMIGQRRIQEND